MSFVSHTLVHFNGSFFDGTSFCTMMGKEKGYLLSYSDLYFSRCFTLDRLDIVENQKHLYSFRPNRKVY